MNKRQRKKRYGKVGLFLDKLIRKTNIAQYLSASNSLIQGSKLEVENLDPLWGLYTQSQIDSNFLEDYELTGYVSFGMPLYRKKSELGVKYHIYDAKELTLQKDIK